MGNLKKTIGTTSLVLAIGTGTFAGMYHYQTGAEYRPVAQGRELQANQVQFSDDDDIKQNKKDHDTGEEDKSALWKKDEKFNQEQGLKPVEDAAYIFEGKDVNRSDSGLSDNQDYIMPQEPHKGEIYDVTDDRNSADVVIRPNSKNDDSGDSKDNNSGNNQNNGNANKDNSNTGDSGDNGGNGDAGDNGNNDNGDNGEENQHPNNDNEDNKDNKDNKDDSGDKPNQPEKKEPLSDTAVDEDIEKPLPDSVDFATHPRIFDEVEVSNEKYVEPVIQPYYSSSSLLQLYKGQTITDYAIFCAMDTYVRTDKNKVYLWKQEHYGTYIRVSGVSFDGGKSIQKKFPVTIPADIEDGQMKVYVDYRMKKTSGWSTKMVDYIPQDARCYILSEALTQPNQKITSDMLLNQNDQYYQVGDRINLLYYRYQEGILGTGRVRALLPGWTCKDEKIPWFYTVTAGRQILEPMDLVPLDEKYTVELPLVWLDDEGRVDPVNGGNLSSLQTLTHVATGGTVDSRLRLQGNTEETLVVPRYVQAVDIADPLTVDKLVIPDSVIDIADNEGGLKVEKAYQVSAGNDRYSSDDGVLYDKTKEEILGIPCEITAMDVPASVKKIEVPMDNNLSSITLEASETRQLPELKLDNVKNCKIILKGDLLKEYLINNEEMMQKNRCVVAAMEAPQVTYSIRQGCIISNLGDLHEVLDSNGSSVNIPSGTKSIDAGAFAEANQVNTIVLSEDTADDIVFRQGCFEDSQLDTIICDNKKQYDNVIAQQDKFGKTEISVVMMDSSQDGFKYYIGSRDGKKYCQLIRAPKELTSFNGKIDNGRITVSEIGDNAFANNTSLKFVSLPEEVKSIGKQAFYGCTQLQGILIDSRDTIYIGNKAFENCENLRFVASNAMSAQMQSGYNPLITSEYGTQSNPKKYFYILQGAQGYGDNANSLPGTVGLEYYSIFDMGENGKVLYGTHSTVGQWYAIRSTQDVPEHIKLPTSTNSIGDGAFADTKAAKGSFDFNWSDLNQLVVILDGAFQNSQLAGDIVIGENAEVEGIELHNNAFYGCTNITSVDVKSKINYTGEAIFSQCDNLQTATFAGFRSDMGIMAGTFDGCNQLSTIEFKDEVPVKLEIHYPTGFQFNYSWDSQSEEAERLQVIVPENIRMACIKEWRYLYLGCIDTFYGTSYLQLWDNIQWDMLDWETWEFPEPAEVDAEAKRQVLEAENVVRKTLGMEEVTEPTDLYLYREEQGTILLTGVPSYIQDVVLSGETMELADGWYLDEIASGAFSGAADLRKVTILNTLSVIHNDMLSGAGANSDTVTLEFEDSENNIPPTFIGGSEQEPFTFGMDDMKVQLAVSEELQESYLRVWKYQMLGYENEEAMKSAVTEELKAVNENVTEEEILQEMTRRVAPQEQRLRAMMVEKEK